MRVFTKLLYVAQGIGLSYLIYILNNDGHLGLAIYAGVMLLALFINFLRED